MRIPTHTLDSAPPGAQPLLEALSRRSLGSGKLLNLHAEMAHGPAVVAAYVGFRNALDEHATFTPKIRAAIMLTVSGADGVAYTQALNSMLAKRAGWSDAQVAQIQSGGLRGDDRLAALLAVAREAGSNGGRVAAETWTAALEAGWTDSQLAEAFAFIGLTVYVNLFVNYAGTEFDVPATAP